MAKELRFSPKLFEFLEELKKNNNKEWFEPNKARYLEFVRDPFLAFIAAFRPRLQNISPFLVADPKPVGGSMMRIYRDIRFSRSKEPYKTNAAAFFHHQDDKESAPGVYLHLEPGTSFLALGLWHPETALRRQVTDAIAERSDDWKSAISDRAFRSAFKMSGESLNRAPKQYGPEHPFAEDLKRKDFVVTAEFSQAQVCAKGFIDRVDKLCRTSRPYLEFLTRAVGKKF